MSRHHQDIPIRPRYGILDDPSEDIQEDKEQHPQDSGSKSVNIGGGDKVASSYSEIPFLAKYPCTAYHEDYEENMASGSSEKTEGAVGGEVDSSLNNEENDSPEEDEELSKSSSSDDNIDCTRSKSLQCESSLPCRTNNANNAEPSEMRHFVADTLEEELRSASPLYKKEKSAALEQLELSSYGLTTVNQMPGGPLTGQFLQTQLPQIDANVLNDIEIEAQYLAASIDNLTENLGSLLHSISSITADNVDMHKNAINKLTDSMDANIKCMYTIMAKTEEITKSMKPTELLGQRIREIKRLVDILDSTM